MAAKLVTKYDRTRRFLITARNGRDEGPLSLGEIADLLKPDHTAWASQNAVVVTLVHQSARAADDVSRDLGLRVRKAIQRIDPQCHKDIRWMELP